MIGALLIHEGIAITVIGTVLAGVLGALGWFCACAFHRLLHIERRLTRVETRARIGNTGRGDTDFDNRL